VRLYLYVILLFAFITGCRKAAPQFDYSDFTHVVKKNKFDLYVPGYLYPDKKLYKNADLQYSDSLNTTFLLVIREEIPDLSEDSIEITLDEYLAYAQTGIVESLDDASGDKDTISRINGVPALSAELEGAYAGHDVYYRITVFMNDDYFYQVIFWTLKGLKEERETDFLASTASFKIL